MLRSAIKTLLPVALLSSCATVQNYSAPQSGNVSHVRVARDIQGPWLGISTTVYKLASPKRCGDSLDVNNDKHLMTIDKTNPLVRQFNENGVAIESGDPLLLQITSIAGNVGGSPYICSIHTSFTPAASTDYEIRLSGRINVHPYECTASLWSKHSAATIYEKTSFETYNECK